LVIHLSYSSLAKTKWQRKRFTQAMLQVEKVVDVAETNDFFLIPISSLSSQCYDFFKVKNNNDIEERVFSVWGSLEPNMVKIVG
jgi:hypothetical protein